MCLALRLYGIRLKVSACHVCDAWGCGVRCAVGVTGILPSFLPCLLPAGCGGRSPAAWRHRRQLRAAATASEAARADAAAAVEEAGRRRLEADALRVSLAEEHVGGWLSRGSLPGCRGRGLAWAYNQGFRV
jgi:hypothetical protein